MEPDKNLLVKSGNLYRVQIAVSPLLPREMGKVIEAFTRQWAKPEDVERARNKEAGVLILSGEGHLRLGEKPEDIAQQINIFGRIAKYVGKISADIEAGKFASIAEVREEFKRQRAILNEGASK